MITPADVAKVDENQLHMIYEKWPEHFRTAYRMSAALEHEPSYYRSIALCGMGGSATSCDILDDLLRAAGRVPSTVVRGQSIPSYIGKRSLVMVNSVSGNTEEAIMMMKEASKRNAEVICISSGGQLEEIARALGHRHIKIPNFSLPRASLPYLLMPGLKLLSPFLEISTKSEVDSIYRTLIKIRNRISVKSNSQSNIAKQLANFLEGGFTFCFASPALLSAATRFKNSLNENAKVHCLQDSVLEASHNEIVPFTFDNEFSPKVLLLRWSADPRIVNERFEKINKFFMNIKQPVLDITAFEKSLVKAIISSIYILDYATIYMAVARGVDPTPTPAIDILKNTK